MPSIDNLADVQGFILRGYRVAVARHFLLQIVQPTNAKRFLASLVSGSADVPQITTAAPWKVKPEIFLNLGLTAAGLHVLNVNLDSFPETFRSGATCVDTAERIGDTDASAPNTWIGGLSEPSTIHVVLSLWAMNLAALDTATAALRVGFKDGCVEHLAHDAAALPNNQVHFGYVDNIAQPTIDGAPPRKHNRPDNQPLVATGAFLMGYPSQNPPHYAPYSVSPESLSKNSSFGAFRILAQDVAGFEQFLTHAAQSTGLDREMIAAKVCGRWRNGVPLVLSPDTSEPQPPLDRYHINNFAYVAGNDTEGYKCPIGSHIRRTNPRDEAVIGGDDVGHLHRIVRRAMPYGSAYDPANPDDTHERGLIGWFINVDLANQFEFLMSSWVNKANFVKTVNEPNTSNPHFNIAGQDVLIGTNTPKTQSTFIIPQPTGNLTINGFERLTTTRGGAYCYLPSITAIKYLAALPDTTAQ